MLSCFGPERHHKLMKTIMRFSFNKAAGTALAYDVRQWYRNILDPKVLQCTYLDGLIHEVAIALFDGTVEVHVNAWSLQMMTAKGMLQQGDLLWWGSGVGAATGFLRCKKAIHGEFLVAFVHGCREMSPGKWQPQNTVIKHVMVDEIVGALPFIVEDNLYLPLFPVV